jgi:hypothetical protein
MQHSSNELAWLIWLACGLFIINLGIKAYAFVMLWRELKEADKIGGEE